MDIYRDAVRDRVNKFSAETRVKKDSGSPAFLHARNLRCPANYGNSMEQPRVNNFGIALVLLI